MRSSISTQTISSSGLSPSPSRRFRKHISIISDCAIHCLQWNHWVDCFQTHFRQIISTSSHDLLRVVSPVCFKGSLLFKLLSHVSPAPPISQSLLVLNCMVLGESRNEIFPVEIAGTKSVGSLKELIKEKKQSPVQSY